MKEQNEKLKKSRRRLPHWDLAGATYFVTFRVLTGEMSGEERQIVLDHIRSGDQKYYALITLMVMPDHVHLLLRPMQGFTLSRVMKGMKGVSAKRINESRSSSGSLWQDESYDRIMRTEDEAIEKARYILDNPRRAGLVQIPSDYPFKYTSI